MKKHTKIYFDHFGYSTGDFIPSELTGGAANDVHHIEARGMGGRKEANRIENLQAVTRSEHQYFGDKKQYKEFLKEVHESFLKTRKPFLETSPNHPILNQYLNHYIALNR